MYNKMKQTVLEYEQTHQDVYDQVDNLKPTLTGMTLVWATKILQNWKSCIRSIASDTQLFYELTYNGDKDQLYVDVYKKFDQKKISLSYGTDIRYFVFQYVKEHLDKTDNVKFTIDDVYIVWHYQENGIGIRIRAMLSTNLPDGMYYELSYEPGNTFYIINAYKKYENYTVNDYTKSEEIEGE